jgi:hypothetical protein
MFDESVTFVKLVLSGLPQTGLVVVVVVIIIAVVGIIIINMKAMMKTEVLFPLIFGR